MSEQAGLKAGGVKGAGVGDTPVLGAFPTLLRNKNFLVLWMGAVVSALGDRIHMVVMLALVSRLMAHKLGRPGYEVGTMEQSQLTVMMLSPFLLLGPFTGALADRFNRRAIMITCDLARVVLVIAARLIFLRESTILSDGALYGILLGTEFLLASFAAMFSPARVALLPELVHPTQLLRANSLTSAAGTIASLLGFVVGGALISWDLSAAMFVDAGTFFASAVFLFFMRVPKRPVPAGEDLRRARPGAKKAGVVQELLEGVRYIKTHRRVLEIILLLLMFWSCGAIILNGLTGIVTHYYGLKIESYANFMGVIGLGMVLGAASVSVVKQGLPKEIGIGWATVGLGFFLLLFSLVSHWQPALLWVTCAASCGAVLLVTLETLLQRIVPNYVRGRVMGARDVITTAGLVGFTIPLALYPDVDQLIRIIMLGLAMVVVAVGAGLVIFYYRRQPLPLAAAILLRFTRGFLAVWHRFERQGACTIPGKGPVVVVANHISAMDPVILQASSPRRIIHFMMAKEYYEKRPWHWLCKAFGTIPVNRSGTDIAAVRAALRVLKEGRVIGLFPEGKISETGEMQEAQHGVAAIVLMAGATVVPAHIEKGMPYQGMVKDFTKRGHVNVRYGRPMRFEDFAGKDRDKAVLEAVTGRIMGAIAGLKEGMASSSGKTE